VRRLLVAVVVLAGAIAAGLGASPARATNECRGLMICVRVAGPWVVVPRGGSAPRPRVQFQLSCPRGYVIGGLDAELTNRGIDITFLGKLGSPVGPGVTTERSAVFVASYVGPDTATGPASFRPHLGCLPAAGGGGGPVPYRPNVVVPPGEPTIRRVRTVRLHPGTVRALQACGRGELLVEGWNAVAFFTSKPPTAELSDAVATRQTIRGGRVSVVARAGPAIGGVRAVVQVGAVCGGGR
jgi:hypothetical protein